MSGKSYEQQNYRDTTKMVMQTFIEGTIKTICAPSNNERVFFEFTSEYRNDLDHKDPSSTDNTRVIYYTLPPQHTSKDGEIFLKIAKMGEFSLDDVLPPYFYTAVNRKNFDVRYIDEDGEYQNKSYTQLKNTMKTYGDLPKDFWEKLEKNLISTVVVPERGNEDITKHVRMRTAKVCEYLPKQRPIKLVLPVHFGAHYHTYLLEIGENNKLITERSITTINSSSYPDEKVLEGMKQGIIEGLKLNRNIEVDSKIIDAPQGDCVSCGIISALVCTLINPNQPLSSQDQKMKDAVKAFRSNKASARSVLTDISYSGNGLDLYDRNNTAKKPSAQTIFRETQEYCSVFNTQRPFTYGLRMREKDKFGIFAVRVTDDHCEVLSVSNYYENFNRRIVNAIQKGITIPLGVDEHFFQDPIYFAYNPEKWVNANDSKDVCVGRMIDPNKPLKDQASSICEAVIGNPFTHPEIGDLHETVYSFKRNPLTVAELKKMLPNCGTELKIMGIDFPQYEFVSSDMDDESKESSSEYCKKEYKDIEHDSADKEKALNEEMFALLNAFMKKFKRDISDKKSHLPLPVLFDQTRRTVRENEKPSETVIFNQALQYAAIQILQEEYEKQQDDKERHYKIAFILSFVFFFIPGISHAIIWGIYAVLHAKDIKKLTISRDKFNQYDIASNCGDKKNADETMGAEARIHHPKNSPVIEEQTIKGSKSISTYDFREIYGEGNPVIGKKTTFPGDVHIYFWDTKKAKRFEEDFQKWEDDNQSTSPDIKTQPAKFSSA